MKLTLDEMAKFNFPAEINVLIAKPNENEPLKVVAIEPVDIPWKWPEEKIWQLHPNRTILLGQVMSNHRQQLIAKSKK